MILYQVHINLFNYQTCYNYGDREIIEKIKLGTVFYNPNIKTNLIFRLVEWSGNIEDKAKINCIDKVTGYSHVEEWDDMNVTVTALAMGEYKFIESVEGLSHV